MGDDWLKILEELANPVAQAERILRIADRTRTRTDPWRWYCRLCGATGEHDNEPDRDLDADNHLTTTRCGRGQTLGAADAGRLLHVWTY